MFPLGFHFGILDEYNYRDLSVLPLVVGWDCDSAHNEDGHLHEDAASHVWAQSTAVCHTTRAFRRWTDLCLLWTASALETHQAGLYKNQN